MHEKDLYRGSTRIVADQKSKTSPLINTDDTDLKRLFHLQLVIDLNCFISLRDEQARITSDHNAHERFGAERQKQ